MHADARPRTLREVVLDQLSTGESRAHRMWLPPLSDPAPLNELLVRHDRKPLRFAMGIIDEPRLHRQDVWVVDVSSSGGNVGVGGAPKSGKSTLLQTFMMSAAATHSPRDVQFYCIDLGGGALAPLERLPHVAMLAGLSERERVRQVMAEVQAVTRQREHIFGQHRVDSMAAYRDMRANPTHVAAGDPFGDVFLLIDGWPAFLNEYSELEPIVQDVAAHGLSVGIHTVISTPRWADLNPRIRDCLGTKIEFRLDDVNDTKIDQIAREIPANRPGRAISMEKRHLMVGVPRLDGVHGADNLVRAIETAVVQIAASHSAPASRLSASRAAWSPET